MCRMKLRNNYFHVIFGYHEIAEIAFSFRIYNSIKVMTWLHVKPTANLKYVQT